MIEAITFDFWNTLYKLSKPKETAVKRASDVREVLGKLGIEISIEKIGMAFKDAWEKAYFNQRVYGKDMSSKGYLKDILKQLGLVLETGDEEEVYKAYTRTLLEILPTVNSGVLETLPVLAQRFKLAVICNSGATPGSVLRKIMEKDGILAWFDFLAFSDEVGFAKPSVEIFQYTLENLGMENINAAHIGDDVLTDIIGAKKAGMKAVWLAPRAEWAVPEADYHVRSVEELARLF